MAIRVKCQKILFMRNYKRLAIGWDWAIRIKPL